VVDVTEREVGAGRGWLRVLLADVVGQQGVVAERVGGAQRLQVQRAAAPNHSQQGNLQ